MRLRIASIAMLFGAVITALSWITLQSSLKALIDSVQTFAPAGSGVKDNETLEFLGDSVLGFLVAEALYNTWPDFREGALSKARSHLVSETHFASLARKLDVGPLLRLAQGDTPAARDQAGLRRADAGASRRCPAAV